MGRKLAAVFMAVFMVLVLSAMSVSPAFAVSKAEAKAQARAYNRHSLGLTSVKNARDLGGYKTKDGRTVKFGKLLRTAELTDVSAADQKKLVRKYKLKKEIDFRTESEMRTGGQDTKMTGVRYYNFPFAMGPVNSWLRSTAGLELTARQLEELVAGDFDGNLISAYYGAGYMSLYLTDEGRAMFRAFFDELLDANGDTVLFHCASGKDRAGNAAMLLLCALGVDRETAIADYMLTNDYYAEDQQQIYDRVYGITGNKSVAKDLSYLLGVRRVYIERSFETIDAHYGSVNNFLKKGLGLSSRDIQKLRNAYLQ